MKTHSSVIGPSIVATILFAVIALFWPTFRDLSALGTGTDEVTHRIFAVPVFLVLVWGLRFELLNLPIRSFWLGLIGLVGAGAVWLVGELAFIRLLTDVAVIAMVPLAVLTVLGYRWLWALSFPLFYLLFAVPFRGPLVAMQVDWTAKFTHMWLLASGVPVHREGPYFEVPTGVWVVADACSGVEYLSACLMLTVLYAWTMYASIRKRLVFIAGGLLVGICGNWLRAYLTILIAHVSDNRFLRDDHGTFGWVLFAVLLFSYCLIGWKFRDREAASELSVREEREGLQWSILSASWRRLFAAFVTVFTVLGVWPVVAHSFARPQPPGLNEIADVLPEAGWVSVGRSFADWQPTLVNPTLERVQSFEKNGRRVDLFIGIFANQTWSSKLVTEVNSFFESEDGRWSLVDRGITRAPYLDGSMDVKTGTLLNAGSRLMARRWYWLYGTSTSDDVQAKLQQLRARFNRREDVTAWITVYSPVDRSVDETSAAMDEFMLDMGRSLERALVQTTQGR